ncbi:MAG: hypothetical protein ACREID_02085, partial [Planctomycetota bacterium]
LVTAEVYAETNPHGVDGRWAAVRLLQQLQRLTHPSTAGAEKFAPIFWASVEQQMKIYLAIAEGGQGQDSRVAARDGVQFATALLLQFTQMDGPERVARVKELQKQLQRFK